MERSNSYWAPGITTPNHCDGMMYQIKPGDTLYLIAKKYHSSIEALLHANHGIDPYNLQIGSQLCIPGATPGQTMPSIPMTPAKPTPAMPSVPTTPAKPTPAMPSVPMTPASPTTPSRPTPSMPSMPERPIPGTPMTPASPTPAMPSVPMTPASPTTPSRPTPTMPSMPERPVPSTPMTPARPTPAMPATPTTPAKPVKPTPSPTPITPVRPPHHDPNDSYYEHDYFDTPSCMPEYVTPQTPLYPAAPLYPTPRNEAPDYGWAAPYDSPAPGTAPARPVQPVMPHCGQGSAYTVKKGDTLAKILAASDLSFSGLQSCNPEVDLCNLTVGQQICLPAKRPSPRQRMQTSYIVNRGDTLARIAAGFKVSADCLLTCNPTLRPADFSKSGTKIRLPHPKR